MRALSTLVILALTMGPALADSVTVPFGTAFDTSLGTLTKVTLTVGRQVDVAGFSVPVAEVPTGAASYQIVTGKTDTLFNGLPGELSASAGIDEVVTSTQVGNDWVFPAVSFSNTNMDMTTMGLDLYGVDPLDATLISFESSGPLNGSFAIPSSAIETDLITYDFIPIPEPSTLVLCALVVGVGIVRWRR